MPRWTARPLSDRTLGLANPTKACPTCGGPFWAAAKPQQSLTTLDPVVRFQLQLRSGRNPDCPRRGACLRPEQEGRFALPHHEPGLDVIALIGTLRHPQRRSIPEIHSESTRRGVVIARRAVTNLLDRYDELLALPCSDTERLRRVTAKAGRVILAIDGLQPDVGHEVLWVIRDVLSGEVLYLKSLEDSLVNQILLPWLFPIARTRKGPRNRSRIGDFPRRSSPRHPGPYPLEREADPPRSPGRRGLPGLPFHSRLLTP